MATIGQRVGNFIQHITGDHITQLFINLQDGGCTCPGDVSKAFGEISVSYSFKVFSYISNKPQLVRDNLFQ